MATFDTPPMKSSVTVNIPLDQGSMSAQFPTLQAFFEECKILVGEMRAFPLDLSDTPLLQCGCNIEIRRP